MIHIRSLLLNPDFAVILLLAGILFLYAEFNRPGTIVLACVGTLCTMSAIYGLAQHPIQPISLGLAIVALILVPLGVYVRPLAPIGGSLLAYSLVTLESPAIHLTTAALASLIFSTVTFWLGCIALQARRNKLCGTKAGLKPRLTTPTE